MRDRERDLVVLDLRDWDLKVFVLRDRDLVLLVLLDRDLEHCMHNLCTPYFNNK